MKWISRAFLIAALASSVGHAREVKLHQTATLDFRPYGGEDTITATFSGSNVPLLRDYLVRSNAAAAKGEFETTSDHEARLHDLRTLLAPIDATKFYAFPVVPVSAKYEADQQEWHLTTTGGCKSYPGREALWECLSAIQRVERPGYMGQNAYGATAMISNVTYNDIRFVVSSTFPKAKEVFREGGLGEYELDIRFAMPIKVARRYAGAAFEVYAIGYLVAPWVRVAKPINISPTISDPQRTQMNSVTLPMLAQQLIVVAKGHSGAVAVISLSGKPLVAPAL